MASVAIAISFFVIIIAVSVSAGFRSEIRSGISGIAGDVNVDARTMIDIPPIEGVEQIRPVVWQTGIIKQDDLIQGVVFKGVESGDTVAQGVRIPAELSKMLGLEAGDRMLAYFVGEKVRARNFVVTEVYPNLVRADDKMIVYASIDDLRRVAGMQDDECSNLEIVLDPSLRGRSDLMEKTAEIGSYVYPHTAVSTVDSYPQLFDWLSLIDFNVLAVIALMSLVAGFNMISGLLILLFRSIPTIGTLKALGMTDRGISGVFLRVGSRIVTIGMLAGNALALIFCVVQDATHILKLEPENYFVSFVPVSLNLPAVIAADAAAYAVIMLLLLIPTLFISGVDPSRTMRAA